MARTLYIPKERKNLTQVEVNELFRFTRETADGTIEGCIGIVVGSKERNLLYVTSGGTVKSGSSSQRLPKSFTFIDYLTEDDSITIFGGADNADQIDAPPVQQWDMPPPAGVHNIPEGRPFLSRYRGSTVDWPSLLIKRGKQNLIISFDPAKRYGSIRTEFGGECYDMYMAGDATAHKSYTFLSWLDPGEWLPRFAKHQHYPDNDAARRYSISFYDDDQPF